MAARGALRVAAKPAAKPAAAPVIVAAGATEKLATDVVLSKGPSQVSGPVTLAEEATAVVPAAGVACEGVRVGAVGLNAMEGGPVMVHDPPGVAMIGNAALAPLAAPIGTGVTLGALEAAAAVTLVALEAAAVTLVALEAAAVSLVAATLLLLLLLLLMLLLLAVVVVVLLAVVVVVLRPMLLTIVLLLPLLLLLLPASGPEKAGDRFIPACLGGRPTVVRPPDSTVVSGRSKGAKYTFGRTLGMTMRYANFVLPLLR